MTDAPVAEGERVLVAWCPDWAISAAGYAPGDLVAVTADRRVVTASAGARAAGVGRGMRVRDAQARCPDLVVVPLDVDAQARAFEPVVQAIEQLVTGVEVIRPGVCAMRSRGLVRVYGAEDEAAAAIVAEVTEPILALRTHACAEAGAADGDGAACWVGAAAGVFAAGLAARRGVIVPPGRSGEFVASWPVQALDLPDVVDLLVRLGITTLGEFAALPAGGVQERMGAAGLHAYAQVHGWRARTVVPRAVEQQVVARQEFDPPADSGEQVVFAAKALAGELVQQLAGRGLACACVQITLGFTSERGGDGARAPASRAWRLDEVLPRGSGQRHRPARPLAGGGFPDL